LTSSIVIAAANVVVWLYPQRFHDPLGLGIAAALVAVAGVLLSMQWKFGEKQEERSKFYLDKSLSGWDRAYGLLKESLTTANLERRTKWIAAARILERARQLSEEVSAVAHRDVLEIELTHQRQRFHQFFEQLGPFYYGVNPLNLDNIPAEHKLDEAAKQSTAGEGTTISVLRGIPESVIHTVWRALQYPPDYWDVIDKAAQFDEGPLLFLDPGLREYINHTRNWQSAAGKLWPRKPPV
jgi:hypothetical protein